MDRTKLKNYAPTARREFIQAMIDQASYYGITAARIEPMTERGDVAVIAGREHSISIAKKRKKLEERIRRDGFQTAMEAIAYTWFNRLVAIRYMELKGYLDHGYRVLSHPDNKPIPELLQYAEYVELPGLKKDLVIEWKLAGNKESELYRLLLTAQCNALSRTIPFLFGWIDDETDLLLPNNLLKTDSLIRSLVENLTAEDCESVEVLGWLYQFYISERKDQVMARKSAVPTEDIPAVTQLFTPHWIVRYLVENSLGRLWLLNRPSSRLREHMPYYIESEPESDYLKITKPEEIRLCDPAVGSGHMLTYAFDLLTLIYEEEGYTPTEIPALILRHNLYGLEICPRAAQLAELALVFKAREKSRRFFQPEHLVQPHVIELRDVRFEEDELRDYIHTLGLGDLFTQDVLKLLHQFENAKNPGSLIMPCLDEQTIADLRSTIEEKHLGDQLFLRETHLKVMRVLDQAESLSQRYHVVVANPPYMGAKQMAATLLLFCEKNFPQGFADLFSCFIERAETLTRTGGVSGLITMQGWLFQPSFVELRKRIFAEGRMSQCLHLGAAAFDTIGGEVVKTVAFTLNTGVSSTSCLFLDLTIPRGEARKEQLFLSSIAADPPPPIQAALNTRLFLRIPGAPAFYKNSETMVEVFETSPSLGSLSALKAGLTTGDNVQFQRLWHEVSANCIFYGCSSLEESVKRAERWYPCSSGGEFRKWYRKSSEIVDWQRNGERIRNFTNETGKLKSRPQNTQFYFRRGFTWNKLSTSNFAVRLQENGWIYDDTSRCGYPNSEQDFDRLFAFLCSSVSVFFLGLLNPSMSFTSGDLGRLPIIDLGDREYITKEAVCIARADWDNFETSWDFRDQPLLRPGLKGATLEASWRNWEAQSTAAIRRMQELETENNRLFIAAYGLNGELQPEVPEEQITLARAEARRDMAAFLSYAVGCMMGRYGLDHPGLILANAGDTLHEYEEKVGKPLTELTFAPDEDGIVPVLDGEWFQDDIVARSQEFLRTTFDDATLNPNIRFIEQCLGKDGKSKGLRDYFIGDFYKDHLQTYKKRPIYWLFSSGKQRAFQCLVYLHRYNEGTLARMRTEYVIPLQGQIAARIDQLEGDKAKATSTSHRNKIQKEQDKLNKQQAELATFEEKLKHYADMRISLDLDDGVKVNYAKFGDLLAESKAITGGKNDE